MRQLSSALRILLLASIALGAAIFAPIAGRASLSQSGPVRGQVVLPSGQPVNNPIRLTLSGYRVSNLVTFTDSKGRFAFSGVSDGTYTLEVEPDSQLYERVSQEVRVIYGNSPPLLITLREKAGAVKKSDTNIISLSEMDHNVPAEAKKEFEKGVELSGKGKFEDAIERFKKAITIYPKYLMAHNNMGVQYLKLGKWSEAEERFKAAIEIDSKVFNPRLNMAIAMIEQRKYVEAIESLNKAISIDSSSPAAHLYLGIASIGIDQLDQAERALSTAISLGGPQQALAHFFLGITYIRKGEREPAIRELNAYLKKEPEGEKAPRAKQLLDKLKQSK